MYGAHVWACLLATFLVNTVQHSTIKVYLSVVCSLHIEQGFVDPLVECLRLQRVLRGIKRTQGDTSSLCLPVTDDIMMVIFHSLDLSLPDHCTWPIFVSCAQRSLLSQIRLAFRPRSIWDSLMWQWIPCHLHHAYGFASRPQKPIHFARGAFCRLVEASSHFVQFTLYWLI